MLYKGLDDKDDTDGLLYWSGVESDSHKNQLKRICGPVVSMIKVLINIDFGDADNIFLERFIRLPLDDLLQMNYCAHILASQKDKNPQASDIFQLISLLLRDHRNSSTDLPEPLEVDALLEGNETCQEIFLRWLHVAASSEVLYVYPALCNRTM